MCMCIPSTSVSCILEGSHDSVQWWATRAACPDGLVDASVTAEVLRYPIPKDVPSLFQVHDSVVLPV